MSWLAESFIYSNNEKIGAGMMDFFTIDECLAMLNEISEGIPSPLLKGLNGGINLSANVKLHPEALAGDLYVLGNYVRDGLGAYIMIYYGSLAMVYKNLPRDIFYKKLEDLVYHELTHHIEYRAGERGLEIKDALDMEAYRSQHKKQWEEDYE